MSVAKKYQIIGKFMRCVHDRNDIWTKLNTTIATPVAQSVIHYEMCSNDSTLLGSSLYELGMYFYRIYQKGKWYGFDIRELHTYLSYNQINPYTRDKFTKYQIYHINFFYQKCRRHPHFAEIDNTIPSSSQLTAALATFFSKLSVYVNPDVFMRLTNNNLLRLIFWLVVNEPEGNQIDEQQITNAIIAFRQADKPQLQLTVLDCLNSILDRSSDNVVSSMMLVGYMSEPDNERYNTRIEIMALTSFARFTGALAADLIVRWESIYGGTDENPRPNVRRRIIGEN